MARPASIEVLPNEILFVVLSFFSTRQLLSMTLTSRRFYDLITRLLQTRLLDAATLKGYTLILECYHPSAKLSTPYLFCQNLGIGTCDDAGNGGDILAQTHGTGRLGKLRSLYSHFRPILPEEDHKVRRHPAGGRVPDRSNSLSENQAEYVCQNMYLDSQELFSQLCTITNIVKVGLKRGLFVSCVNIGEAATRVWRDWLAERCASLVKRDRLGSGPSTKEAEGEEYRKRLLWVDTENNIGLRIRVIEREDVPAAVLVNVEEDPPVSYVLQYEELVIRTSQLLLTIEQSIDQEVSNSGNAVVIGSWDQ